MRTGVKSIDGKTYTMELYRLPWNGLKEKNLNNFYNPNTILKYFFICLFFALQLTTLTTENYFT